jgi:hypothetical protein
VTQNRELMKWRTHFVKILLKLQHCCTVNYMCVKLCMS